MKQQNLARLALAIRRTVIKQRVRYFDFLQKHCNLVRVIFLYRVMSLITAFSIMGASDLHPQPVLAEKAMT